MPHPHGWAMGCRLWVHRRKMTVLYRERTIIRRFGLENTPITSVFYNLLVSIKFPHFRKSTITVTWYERHSVLTIQHIDSLFNSFKLTTNKSSNLHITGPLCMESTGGFPSQALGGGGGGGSGPAMPKVCPCHNVIMSVHLSMWTHVNK